VHERGDRFKQDYQTIKRISTFPDVPGISSPLTLCAEHPRGNFEEDSGKRVKKREKGRKRPER
jgi:hypothetical protein